MKTKYFVPSNPNYRIAGKLGCVRYWKWTPRTGLVCHTRDGYSWKSEWRTLREFRIAVRERRETAVIETDVPPDTFNAPDMVLAGASAMKAHGTNTPGYACHASELNRPRI